jgi:hypothetical protein
MFTQLSVSIATGIKYDGQSNAVLKHEAKDLVSNGLLIELSSELLIERNNLSIPQLEVVVGHLQQGEALFRYYLNILQL